MKKIFSKIKTFFLVIILIILLAIIIGGSWFYFTYGKTILRLQSNAKAFARASTEESFKEAQTSLVYAYDGSLISVLKAEKDVYYLEYSKIPSAFIHAMIASEDRKYYSHSGYDILANIRASRALIKNKGEIHQGASTITQQLARIVFLTNEVTWERKITELFLATELEKKYTKDQLMEFYLNNIYFANGHYGIQAAAYGYFNKSVSELSLSEIAFLCTIPNNPTIYDPNTNFNNVLERRNKILDQMYSEGFISKTDYNRALKEKIVLDQRKTERKNYAESYTYYCAIRALMEKEGFLFQNEFSSESEKTQYQEKYNEAYYRIQKTLFTKGYRIYTSIDLEKQEELQKAIDSNLDSFMEVSENGTYQLQASAVCIDNDTGKVVAIIGGRSQEQKGYTLNRAFQSFRQPGSSIKPLVVYTPMFERGLYPDSIVVDQKIKNGPKNADNSFAGEMTVRRAVEVSKNTVVWQLLSELTPKVGLSYLLKMNFAKIVKEDEYLGASLGGLTYGVSAVEMASAYATIANEGIYRKPTCIVQITDASGNILVDNDRSTKQIYEKNAALMMTDVLKSVMTNGTGRKLALTGITSMGKTGTTGNQKDGWFCGYTKYFTTAVWVGYDMPKRMEGLAGNSYPGYIYRDYMNQIHNGLKDMDFEAYLDTRPSIEKIWGEEEKKAYEEERKELERIQEEEANQHIPIDDIESGWLDDEELEEDNNLEDNELTNDGESEEDSLFDNEESGEDDLFDNEESGEDSLFDNEESGEDSLFDNEESGEDDLFDNEESEEDNLFDNEGTEEDNLIDNEGSEEDNL